MTVHFYWKTVQLVIWGKYSGLSLKVSKCQTMTFLHKHLITSFMYSVNNLPFSSAGDSVHKLGFHTSLILYSNKHIFEVCYKLLKVPGVV